MNGNILTEINTIAYDQSVINEANDPTMPLILRNVILQRANARNQNGRIYPRAILFREAKKYNQEFVKENRAIGELDHPDSPIVNLKNASHTIVRMEIVGDDLRGDIKVLTTPSGNIVRELIRNNIKIGVSSRGMGSVASAGNDTVEVQNDYSMICFDIVSNPSTVGAYINEGTLIANPVQSISSLIHDFLVEING